MIKIALHFLLEKIYKQIKSLRINIIFKFPPKTDVLIYSLAREENIKMIREYLPSSKNIYAMNVSGKSFYLEPILI